MAKLLSDYMDMLNRANKNRDRFFRVNSKEWDDFYDYLHYPNNQYNYSSSLPKKRPPFQKFFVII